MSESDVTNTAKFMKAFDPSKESHVKWFKRMTDLSESMNNPNEAITLNAEINMNPMKITLSHPDTLDWFHIHFVLCASYAKAVLKGTAFIPHLDRSTSSP
jgi:hypothetical protein